MKEEIKKFKDGYKEHQSSILVTNKKMIIVDPDRASSDEALRFVNLLFEKYYGEGYLMTFFDHLKADESFEATEKYNIKRVNEHLIKIIEEYKQITDELDAIIFADEEVGQNGTMSEM